MVVLALIHVNAFSTDKVYLIVVFITSSVWVFSAYDPSIAVRKSKIVIPKCLRRGFLLFSCLNYSLYNIGLLHLVYQNRKKRRPERNRKRFLLIITALLISCIMLAGCSSSTADQTDESITDMF